MNNIEKFYQYNLSDTIYDYINCYVWNEGDFCGMNLQGNLNEEHCEYKHFNISFRKIYTLIPIEKINKCSEGIIKSIVVEGNMESGFDVHMELKNCEEKFVLEFVCAGCDIHFLRP